MFLTSQKFVFAISTFVCYTPLLKYNPHTNLTNLYLTQRFRHIFIDFPPLTPDALEPKTTLSRDPPEGRWKSVLMVEAPLDVSSISLIYSNRKVCARYDGQNRRFRSFTTIDPTTFLGSRKVWKSSKFLDYMVNC